MLLTKAIISAALLLGIFWGIYATALPVEDTETLVFTSSAVSKEGHSIQVIYRINADGSNRKQITNLKNIDRFLRDIRSPSVSPIGKKIACFNFPGVHVSDWDGSKEINITLAPREHFQPAWSPDGREIAFVTDRNNDGEIYLMDYDGSNARNISWSKLSSDMSPTWSPDGKKIAFISNRNGKKFELFSMDKTGFNQKLILSLDGDIREPAWGVNNKIAFALEKGGISNLYLVDSDGKNLVQLTNTQNWNGQPAWDSEGKRLAFVSTRSGNSNIWVMNLSDKKSYNLTNDKERDSYFPCWVPKQLSDTPLQITKTNISKANLPRPRMLFRKAQIPGIRKRLEQAPYVSSWKMFLAQCDKTCDPSSTTYKKVMQSLRGTKDEVIIKRYNHPAWNAIFNLAFAYQITGNPKYGKQAAAWLVEAGKMYGKTHSAIESRVQYLHLVACAYDWLYGLLPPDERKALTTSLCTTAQLNYFGFMQNNLCLGPLSTGNSNMGVFMAADFGLLALTLDGEPGSRPDWLAGAIRLTGMCFNNWIGEAGDSREGFAYFASPIKNICPFLFSLKVNHLAPHLFESNLKRTPRWMAISAAHGMTETINIGDCDSMNLWIPSGLRMLYPDDKLMQLLWSKASRGEHPKPVVNELLWWRPAEKPKDKIPLLPRVAHFPNQSYVVMRSGYAKDDPMMTLTNPISPGHAHQETGSVLLYGYGTRFLVDPGQGMGKAQLHNNILINGRGRGQGTRLSGIPLQIVTQGPLGAIAAADLKDAYSRKAYGYLDYKIPAGWMPIEHGSRYLAMVDRHDDRIPPYFVIYDNVKVNDQKNKYESLFLMDMDKQVKISDHQFLIESTYNGPWFAPEKDSKNGTVEYSFKVNTPGDYYVWLYIKDPADSFAFTVNGKSIGGGRARGTTTRSKCWQWKMPIAGKNPVKVKLKSGENKLIVSPHRKSIFSRIILSPTDFDFYGLGTTPKLPKNSILLPADQGKILKGLVLKKPEGKLPKALFAFLNPAPVDFKEKSRRYRTRFFGQQLVILPQVIAERNTVNPRFLTFIYPYREGMEQPKITRSEKNGLLCAKIEWKDATDWLLSAPGSKPLSNGIFETDAKLAIVRKYKDGKISSLILNGKLLSYKGKILEKK